MRMDGTGEAVMLRPGRWHLRASRHKYNAWLNGQILGLADQDERIYIVNIKETAKEENTTAEKSRYDGTWPILRYRSSLEVTLSLQIKEDQPEARMQILRKVIAWCEDGVLRISTRPNMLLIGAFTKMPAGKMRAWTGKLDIVFTAYGLPYWQEDEVKPLQMQGINGSTNLLLSGNTEYAYLSVGITNVSTSTVTSILINTFHNNVQLSWMHLFSLSLPPGETIVIDYDMRHRIIIQQSGEDIRNHLSPQASDDLIIKPGVNSIQFDTDASCRFTLIGRGLYL